MEISPSVSKKVIDEYDFIFVSGMILPVTIDKSLGDTLEYVEGGIKIKLTPKPSLSDPETSLPAEDITIFSNQLLAIQHRTRDIVTLTPEEQYEQRQFFKGMSRESTKH